MARCLSPRSQPYDPTQSKAAEELLSVISDDLGRFTSFTSWGPDAFHMPFLELFIGFWGVHRETCIVEGIHPRALKGKGLAASRSTLFLLRKECKLIGDLYALILCGL